MKKKRVVLNNINKYGNFSFTVTDEELDKCYELNAINQVRNFVYHSNSIPYKSYNYAVYKIHKAIKNLAKDNTLDTNDKLKEMKKTIKNVNYRKSTTYKSIAVLNRKKLFKYEESLELNNIIEQTKNKYTWILNKQYNELEDKDDFCDIIRENIKKKNIIN